MHVEMKLLLLLANKRGKINEKQKLGFFDKSTLDKVC